MNMEIPLMIISILLIISMTFNFFIMLNIWRLKDKLYKLDKFHTLSAVMEEKGNTSSKKGIIKVKVMGDVIGMNDSKSYTVNIEIEEIGRYSNGTSKYKSITILETEPKIIITNSTKKLLLEHYTNKYIDTKDIDFLEKVEINLPSFNEEEPNLIEKIEPK